MSRWDLLRVCLVLLIFVLASSDGWSQGFFTKRAHNRMVAASGIRPPNVGTHEGVGFSTRSYADALQRACYWGQRVPVSIQYSRRNNGYYAVVRYR